MEETETTMPSQSHTTTPRSHSTTQGKEAVWSTKRIAVCGLFVALAFVTSFIEIPIFPLAPYLKYDPSGIVCLIAGLCFGPLTGVVVSVLPWVIRLFLNPWGAVMGMLCTVAFVLPASLIYKRMHTFKGAVLGLCVSVVVMLAAAIAGNVVITPLYSGMDTASVVALIVPVLIPFNLLKIAINCAGTLALYKPVSKMIER
jgi:riboflavin transporter FmnP